MKEYGLRYKWQGTNSILYKIDTEDIKIIETTVDARGRICAFMFPGGKGLVNFTGNCDWLRIPEISNIKAYYGTPAENIKIGYREYNLKNISNISCIMPINDETQIPITMEVIRQNLIKYMNEMPYEILLKRLEGKERMVGESF